MMFFVQKNKEDFDLSNFDLLSYLCDLNKQN